MSIFYVPDIMLGMINTVVYKTDMAFLYLIEFISTWGSQRKTSIQIHISTIVNIEEETHVEFN